MLSELAVASPELDELLALVFDPDWDPDWEPEPEPFDAALALLLPEAAFATGLLLTAPVWPVLPPFATGLAFELPEWAFPTASEFAEAAPELPESPELPDVAFPIAVAAPVDPVFPELPELPDDDLTIRLHRNCSAPPSNCTLEKLNVQVPVEFAFPVFPVVPEFPELPETAVGLLLASPVGPVAPVDPEVAFAFEFGLEVALPVLPAMPVAVAFALPLVPETALPLEFAVASPELDALLADVFEPDWDPDWESEFEPVDDDEPCALPEPAVAFGEELAEPVEPVLPPFATGLAFESPEWALPLAFDDADEAPELPEPPELPDTALPVALAAPLEPAVPESPELPEWLPTSTLQTKSAAPPSNTRPMNV